VRIRPAAHLLQHAVQIARGMYDEAEPPHGRAQATSS
jgi:hypothetical protein